MLKRIRLHTTKAEKQALLKVLQNTSWVTGTDITAMEDNLTKTFHKKYAILTSNGFSALFMAIKSLKIKGEIIYLPEISSCFAMVNAIISSGNKPYFLPVNYTTGNIDIYNIDFKKLKSKYIIFPNHNGITGDIKFLKKSGFIVIEDCAQSFLSSSQKVSAADVQVFSFYPTKTVNGIDGGAILTNNKSIYIVTKQKVYYNAQIKYDGIDRYNFRMPNLHAALFNANFSRLKLIKSKMLSLKRSYDTALNNKIQVQFSELSTDIIYKYILLCKNNLQRKKIVELANEHKIELSSVYIDISDKKLSSSSKELINLSIQLPFFEDITIKEIKQVTKFLKAI